jgi:hypothetical protein
MAERTDELREDIEQKRHDIGYTVDQIQNRVSPGRVTARGRYRARRWFIDTKDRLMGNDQPSYSWESPSQGLAQRAEAMTDRASEIVSEAKETISQAPGMMRQQTRGNPLAAGLVAFGGGMLVGTLLPETNVEARAARRLEPAVSSVASEAGEIGREITEDVKASAGEAMEEVKDTAVTAAEGVKEEARQAADRAKEQTET